MTEKEAHLKKMQVISEGTSHKLKIRKEELDKEWERVDQMRVEVEEREALIQKERESVLAEKELIASEKEEKV